MPTIEEIRTEWQGLRSAIGNLICYIDGKVAQLQDMSEAYKKGYNDAVEKAQTAAEEEKGNIFQTAYQRGLEDAWDIVRRIESLPVHGGLTNEQIAKVFGRYYSSYDLYREFTAHDTIQRLKEYDYIMHKVTHSNAQKFVEVFGFAPGYEILDDGREVYPSLNDEFWNAEYKEPKGEVE